MTEVEGAMGPIWPGKNLAVLEEFGSANVHKPMRRKVLACTEIRIALMNNVFWLRARMDSPQFVLRSRDGNRVHIPSTDSKP